MTKQTIKAPMALAIGVMLVGTAFAKVPASEADHLGKDLTCVGAIKAGNKEGTIPEFANKYSSPPSGIEHTPHSGKHPAEIYASDKPLFAITAENMAQYADKLSPGQKAMLTKYAKTYRIPVYQGRRDFRYTDEICAIAKKNALESEVTEGGLAVKGFMGAINFPIPKTGDELLWNTLMPTRAWTEFKLTDSANVQSNGSIIFGRAENKNLDKLGAPDNRGKPITGYMAYSMNKTLMPERDRGGVSSSWEPTDFKNMKRLTWSYDPGTRRVRQVPEYGFDQPLGGTGGKMTIDSDRLFNGSPERYDWKMVGKQEMFIPANTFKLHQPTVKYADLLKQNHPNPDFLRYELRRVWVLEGSLKQGYRHLFGKRVMFLDEDTGQAVVTDIYDARGQLWQHAYVNTYYSFDIQAWQAGAAFYHDLNAGSYLGYNLYQEREKGPILNKGDLTEKDYTAEAVRNTGT